MRAGVAGVGGVSGQKRRELSYVPVDDQISGLTEEQTQVGVVT